MKYSKCLKNNKIGVKVNLNEEEILNEIINKDVNWFNPNNNFSCYLLFIHWMERKYNL
jgi:hypothetical protein